MRPPMGRVGTARRVEALMVHLDDVSFSVLAKTCDQRA